MKNAILLEPAIFSGSSLQTKMAEDVNNDSPPSKLEERKIVVEFCQLQEKSRQLFNALRYHYFSDVFAVVYHLQAKFV